MNKTLIGLMSAGALCVSASAQSLYEMPTVEQDARTGVAAVPEQGLPLQQVSLHAIEPPEPRTFQEQDLVTIIVSERSSFEREQTLETEKDYNVSGAVEQFIDLLALLETQVIEDELNRAPRIDLNFSNEFEGEGEYGREDTLTTRITARVLEVKPNGTLLLEARTSLTTDEETQTIVLSGVARTEDVTDTNTVQSNQMFDLNLNVQHEGRVREGAKKGLIPRVIEGIFNF